MAELVDATLEGVVSFGCKGSSPLLRPGLYSEAAIHFTEVSHVAFSLDQTKQLLSLYPLARINLAQAVGTGPTDVRDDLSIKR